MAGRVQATPSLRLRRPKYSASPGAPQLIARRKATASGRASAVMPRGSSARAPARTTKNSPKPSASASQTACRNTGPISARRPAPLSWATVGGTAISTPMLTRITTDHTALPTPTAASVTGPWRPASTVSTMFIAIDETCPSTSGKASTKLTRISRSRRATRVSE